LRDFWRTGTRWRAYRSARSTGSRWQWIEATSIIPSWLDTIRASSPCGANRDSSSYWGSCTSAGGVSNPEVSVPAKRGCRAAGGLPSAHLRGSTAAPRTSFGAAVRPWLLARHRHRFRRMLACHVRIPACEGSRRRQDARQLPMPTLIDNEFTFETLYSTPSRAFDTWSAAPTIACAPSTRSSRRSTTAVFSWAVDRYVEAPT